MTDKWDVVIGLEVHAQLNSLSKIFSPDSAEFGGGDNENVSPVSLGMPGTLPLINAKVIELAVKAGLALNCQINRASVFARKNYFYPDLAKGYQISQFDKPICYEGHISFYHEGEVKNVKIERAHLEEDAGKSSHHGQYSLINFNRAGVPLLEIVSAPEICTPSEAADYARAVRGILRYAEVCDGNLEEGSLRCDCNVSIRPHGDAKLGTKVELKNINSFRFIEKALDYEIRRQIDLVESGGEVALETRLYDSTKNKTISMRAKEEAHDYRYFPDPDILPVKFSESLVQKVKEDLPELPLEKAQRFVREFEIPLQDAFFLTQEKDLASYFEEATTLCGQAKMVANWLMSELWREIKGGGLEISESRIKPTALAELVSLISKGEISGKIAKKVFAEMWSGERTALEVVQELGLSQIKDSGAIEKIITQVLANNPSQVAEFKGGKEKVLGFFIGQVMKETQGRANPDLVNTLLKEKLK